MNLYTNSNQIISEKNYIPVLLEIILPQNSETTAQPKICVCGHFVGVLTALLLVLLVLMLFETAFQ